MKTLDQLVDAASELCREIENLPAGEQQTKVSLMAADLADNIRRRADVRKLSAHVMNWPA
jgi:hypothetical protein